MLVILLPFYENVPSFCSYASFSFLFAAGTNRYTVIFWSSEKPFCLLGRTILPKTFSTTISRDLTVRTCSLSVYPIGEELQQVLRCLKASTTDLISANVADVTAQLSHSLLIDSLCCDILDVLPERPVDNHINSGFLWRAIYSMRHCLKKSIIGLGYNITTHNDVVQMNWKAHKKYGKDRLGRFIAKGCKWMVLTVFTEPLHRALGNYHSPVHKIMEQAGVEAFIRNFL